MLKILLILFIIIIFNSCINAKEQQYIPLTRIKRDFVPDDIDPFLGGDSNSNCSIGHFYCDAEINGGRCIPK
jgi:hypothetical protein